MTQDRERPNNHGPEKMWAGPQSVTVWLSPELISTYPARAGWQVASQREMVYEAARVPGKWGLVVEETKERVGIQPDLTIQMETMGLSEGGAKLAFRLGGRRAGREQVLGEGGRGKMRGVEVYTEENNETTSPDLWPIYAKVRWAEGESRVAVATVARRVGMPNSQLLAQVVVMGGWKEIVTTERVLEQARQKDKMRGQAVERALGYSAEEVAKWLWEMGGSGEGRERLEEVFGFRPEAPVGAQEMMTLANKILGKGEGVMVAFTDELEWHQAYYLGENRWKFEPNSEFETKTAIGKVFPNLGDALYVDFFQKKKGGLAGWTFGIATGGGWRGLAIRCMMEKDGL